jgi:serine/threonine-protein kinase RsbW
MSHANDVPAGHEKQEASVLPAGEGFLTALVSWARAFPGTPGHVGAARRFVAHLLQGSTFRDDALVVLSELFTNALLHTDSGKPGGLVTVQVTRWRHGVRIAVTDQGSLGQPVIRDLAASGEPAESGHGLYLAAHLAGPLTWHDDPFGRTVAATLGRVAPTRNLLPSRPAHPVIVGPAGSGREPVAWADAGGREGGARAGS